jgi:hypothetical protein
MKKILMLLMVATMFATVGCNKDDKGNKGDAVGEISFAPQAVELEKGITDGDYDCDSEVHYALVYVDGIMYRMPTFYINGMLYTQSIKLASGAHVLEEFILMNNNGTPDDYTDDVSISAVVHIGAEYEEFTSFLLPYDFTIESFIKKEIHVEVICIEDSYYTPFGFTYFSVWETIVRQIYFFGDVCVPCLEDFYGSDYENQSGGVLIDNAAITNVMVYRNGEYLTEVDNMDVWGEGVVCASYPDRIGMEDFFEFKIYVWLPVGAIFDWVHVYTYSLYDDEIIDAGADNVNEFVLGNCLLEGSETNLSQYFNLPATADFSLGATHSPAAINVDYKFDITFTGIDAGYALENLTYGAYCAEQTVTINLGSPYTANVASSLNLVHAAVVSGLTIDQVKRLHWIANNLEQDWELMQNVIWSVTDLYVLVTPAEIVYEAAMNAGYMNYNPLPNQDEKAMVILETADDVQMQVMDLDVCPN